MAFFATTANAASDLQEQLRAKRELQEKLKAVDLAASTVRLNLEVWLRNPTDQVGDRIDAALNDFARAIISVRESGKRLIAHEGKSRSASPFTW